MAVAYSKRLVRHTGILDTSYTVPAGVVTVVRDVSFVGTGEGTGLYVVAGIDLGEVFYKVTIGDTPSWWRHWEGRSILESGETLFLASDLPAAMLAMGYELTLP